MINSLAPEVVADESILGACLQSRLLEAGLNGADIDSVLAEVPNSILLLPCFLDRLTNHWRYEFGAPYEKGDLVLYGPHVWPLVTTLGDVLQHAVRRLTIVDRGAYFARLFNAQLHANTLVEFQPVLRLAENCRIEYEPHDLGPSPPDWRITSPTATTVIEVKNRSGDLLELSVRLHAGELASDGSSPIPTHDVGLLFRSLESKFPSIDPAIRLQGAWIHTALNQDLELLEDAFSKLDSGRVHFAVIGGWQPGILPLVGSGVEPERILDLFRETIQPAIGRTRRSKTQ